jgi:hypothetical protein
MDSKESRFQGFEVENLGNEVYNFLGIKASVQNI